MTDPADRFLEERLHALARGVPVPVVPGGDDVRRGRRRLFRIRLGMAGATTATLAVVLGVTGLTAGNPRATEFSPATQPTSLLTPTPSGTPSQDDGADSGAGDRDGQGSSAQTGTGGQGAGGPGSSSGADPETQGGDGGAKNAPHGATGSAPGSTGADPHHQPWGVPGLDPTGPPSATVTEPATPTSTPTETEGATPTGSPTPTETATETPTESPTSTPTVPPTLPPTLPPTETDPVRVARVLRYYNDVLADHLDPDRAHLQPYARRLDPKDATSGGGRFFALGSTYRWAVGRSTAGLGVTVATGWDQVEWQCGASDTDWACEAAAGPVAAEVATHDGARQVAVERPDGQVVVVTADLAVGLTEDALAAAASDDRLVVPGDAPVAPPVIDDEDFAEAGVAALVGADESFEQTAADRSPLVRGTWSVDGLARGVLAWSAQPVYAGPSWECLRSYRTCTEVVVDESGMTVHLAAVRPRAGGGWVMQYDGPSYAVRLFSSDRTFPKKRGYAFVIDPAWQPVR